MATRWRLILPLALMLLAWWTTSAEPPKRLTWTTSRITGTPEPPPAYKSVNAFPNLRFDHPLLMVQEPGSNRLYVGEQNGKIFSFPNRSDAKAELFFDAAQLLKGPNPLAKATQFDALYGLAFHPRFVENRTCFVCYTLKGKGFKNFPEGTRVSRFRVTATEPPRIDPQSEEVILSWLQGGHNGGDLHFGPDGYLYISAGDAADPTPPDPFKTGQDNSDFLSSILRIDVDRTDEGKLYSVPKDNPFLKEKGCRPEIWAFGFRNPWRMSFDRATGQLWVGDVGWELWEMVHRVERGGNYGWSIVEGPQAVNVDWPQGPGPIRSPVIELPHTAAASVTGGYFYRGRKFPEFAGAYVFGDWETKRVWAARIENDRLQSLTDLIDPTIRVVAFGQDADGELYIVDYDAGTIHTLARQDVPNRSSEFPRTLSATGLFKSVADHQPSDGVVPFSIQAEQWSDFATAERYVAVPNGEAIIWHAKQQQIAGSMFKRTLEFPRDAVLVKTLSLEMERGNPASRKRIETQILHTDGKVWNAYTYAWNDTQTDAELVPADGAERELKIRDAGHEAGVRDQTWTFAARAQCIQCHTPWAQSTLAFDLSQLNREDQLRELVESGLIRRAGENLPPLNARELAKIPPLCNPAAQSSDLTLRARSYLHANCGHCHRFGGGGALDLELHSQVTLEKTKAIDALPARGNFDLPDARIIAPGDPHRSVLYYRLAKFGRGRMPHLGSEWPDEKGLAVIAEWIRSLKPGVEQTDSVPAEQRSTAIAQPASAMALAREVANPATSAQLRSDVLKLAGNLPAGNARDLFDGYLPQTGERKLGSNPRSAAILKMPGDAKRGQELFARASLQCVNCHRLGDAGKAVGPELTTIGRNRNRAELLESLLEPSRRIEPEFVSYGLTTNSGQSAIGLLVRRDASETVLRDAQGQEKKFAAADVERLNPIRASLMPEGLLRDLTMQQAADLLEFLATRK